MTSADGRPTGSLVAGAIPEKERANTMTMKEKLKIHIRIEAENKRKLDEWKEGKDVRSDLG